jgi:hypothetical protein
LLEAREKRLREMEMELITSHTKLIVYFLCFCILKKLENITLNIFKSFEEHDVNSWTENDVYDWVEKIGLKYSKDGFGAYCEKFLNHNINGKRLLMMNKNDLRNIGIHSEGHIIDLYHEIESLRLENIRLLNFPPLKVTEKCKFYKNWHKIISKNLIYFKRNQLKQTAKFL